MPAPLLETKLYLPGSRPAVVSRPRLNEQLDRGAAARLLLVSAPAGFGKTTLLAEWLATRGASAPSAARRRTAAWLSLDSTDNDPATFWSYLVAALRTVAPGVGQTALGLLHGQQPPPIQVILTTLINELGAVPGDLVLVIDDYHVIDGPDVQEGMAFLVEHAPPRLHLVIASRADPALPLARMRVRGELVEVRASDLRFTPGEAAAYLNDMMGLQLTAHDVTVLERRTEGWIAALQLAALSLRGRVDVAGFIDSFAGDDRYVVDYLVEEVVQRQPGPVQDFLQQTAILGRLSGPLCDAVTGQRGGHALLERLDRDNLFLVPLDDRREWYRYHHLFADVLHARLLNDQPHLVPDLHRRASAWCEQNGERSVAIRHALAAQDFERAAELIERAMPAMRRDRQETMLRGWLELLPDEIFPDRPVLSIGYVGARMASGQLDGVEVHLQNVERWLAGESARSMPPPDAPTAPAGTIVVDPEELRRLPGWVAVFRAGQALLSGDAAATVAYAKQGRDRLPVDDHLGHGAATALIGLAAWGSGDLTTAHDAYAEGMTRLRRAGHVADVLGCAIALADIRLVQGRLSDAMQTYQQSLQLASEQRGPALRGTCDMYVGMSAVHLERNDLSLARQLLARSEELGEHTGLPQNPYRWRVAMSRILTAEGDLPGALELLDDADRRYVGDFSPNVRPVPAMRARTHIALGRLDEALGWARQRELSAAEDPSYLREFEHVTLARLLLAQYTAERDERCLEEATRLLGRLLLAAETGARAGSLIEVLVLQALAHRSAGDVPRAVASLHRALALAEREGYVRVFVDEGPAMASLLKVAEKRPAARDQVRRLLGAFDNAATGTPLQRGLVDPLSARELEVVRLLGTELSGPDIARELVVSLNTVRTHTKSIYAKLGVNSRRAAARRATELGLMSRSRPPER